MAFWGVEVKPGRPYTHQSGGGNRRLHLSQASLGNGTATNKSVLQCNVGNKRPIWLCSLFPLTSEVCQIHVEYQETEDVVFSVIGPRSVHLSGYYADRGWNNCVDDDSDSYGEDIEDADTERSVDDSEEDDLDNNNFINDGDPGFYSDSLGSGDEVEEVEAKPVNRKGHHKRLRKAYQVIDSDDGSSDHQYAGIGDVVEAGGDNEENDDLLPKSSLKQKLSAKVEKKADLPSNNLPSEDGNKKSHLDELKSGRIYESKEKLHEADGVDDFFSASILKWPKQEKEESNNKVGNGLSLLKDVAKEIACCGTSISLADQVVADNDQECKKPKKRTIHELGKPLNVVVCVSPKTKENVPINIKDDGIEIISSKEFGGQSVHDNSEKGQRKKRKSKRQELGKLLNAETFVPSKGEDNQPANIEGVAKAKLSQFPGGLLVEELKPGKMNGRLAVPGRKISVSYTGKWKGSGEAFNSNVDGRPLKFVLGGEGVMEAWNVGLNGMRVGESRRLTIPAASWPRSSSSTREGNGSEDGDGGEVIPTTIPPPLPLDSDQSEGAEGVVYDINLLKVRKERV
ncbi:unnamed protein product [Linum trigynum]|uniref:peptidylprolyl isomerase n=1 Tax=Linum trigynum TaxID=586398 RepID=A0AAV2E142_9ROSI